MKMTKAEWQEQSRKDSAQRYMFQEALASVIAGGAITVGTFTADDWKYTVKLVNPTRAHGGLIVTQGTAKGQNPSWPDVNYLDDLLATHRNAYWSEFTRKLWDVLGKAIVVRDRSLSLQSAPNWYGAQSDMRSEAPTEA